MKYRKLDLKNSVIVILISLTIGIMMFTNSLVDLTLAWFHTNMTVNDQSIVAANFDLDVSIYSASNMKLIEKKNGKYKLESGNYNITLKRIGSSKNSKGYSSIKIGDKEYVSAPLGKNEVLKFTLIIDSPMDISFNPVWGEATIDNKNVISNSDTISILVNVPTSGVMGDLNNNSIDVSQNETVDNSIVESAKSLNNENKE